MTDFESIPDELQERNQWLYWNSSADKPRKPLESPTAEYGAAWSDPDAWMSFEEVVDNAEMVPNSGIGYVNAADNDDYARGMYGVIDLDGVVAQDGVGTKDWVPSLQPFFDRDAYMERSPSGDGIHIPVVGIEVPDWWADEHFTDEEHEGIEVLTNKFSTFTGDQLQNTSQEVVEYGEWLDDWLREAYKQLYGEDPLGEENVDQDTDNQYTHGDEWLTDEAVEAALDAIDPDVGYDTWKDIGMALANHLGTAQGGSLFKQWSRSGTKWDSDAEDQAERIINDASNYNYDAATIVYHATNHGWNASAAAREYGNARSDGGGAAVSRDDTADMDIDTSRDWTLGPLDVLELAVRDPFHPADIEDEGGYDHYPRDLRANERANYTWMLAKKTGDDDLLAQRHGPILAYQDDPAIWKDDDKQSLRELANDALGSAFSGNVVNEIEENIRSDPEKVKEPDDLGAPDETIMTDAGLLHLRDRDIEPGKPDHLARANLPHQPDWTADCPRWQSFIDDSIETEEERLKFQEYCGYCLWRHAQTFGKAMLLVGPTDSGKSTALKVIRHVIGEENVASESLQNLIETRWGKAQLVGNIANIREEVTPSGLKNIEAFKELTGGEGKVTAEYKGQPKFDFVVTQKFLFATNEVPSVQHADEAFYNRLLFVRFPNSIPRSEQDPNLDDKLKAEAPGILNWMLDGLDRLLDQQTFTGERSINDKKELCDAFGGVIDRFTHNCLMVTGNSDDVVSKSDLHDLAQRYADDIDKEPGWNKQNGFTQQMKNQRGISDTTARIDGDPTNAFAGVRVKPEVVYRYGMDIKAECDDGDETDGTRLDHYQDDDIRPGYDIRKERDVIPLIIKLVNETDANRIEHDTLVDQLADEGVDESKAEAKIEKALRRGDLVELETGVYHI